MQLNPARISKFRQPPNKMSRMRNALLGVILISGIVFSYISIVGAAKPDPGHNFTESSGGLAQGDLLYGSAADTLSALAKDANATRYISNSGASNNPAWAQINLSNGVTNTLAGANGGTGVANTGKTITLGGNLTTSGAYNATLTLTGDSSVTLPAGTKTLVATDVTTLSSLTSVGTIATGAWNADTIADGKISSTLTGKTYNGLSLATTANGFTVTGGTTPHTLTLTGDATISGSPLANPMTTQGDIIYGGASGAATRLGGSAGFLKSTGAAAPAWSSVSLTSDVGATILPVANGGTGLAAAVNDAVLVGDSASAYTARALPSSCAGTSAKLLYDSTTNLFSCGTDQTGAAGTAEQFNQSTAAQGAGFATDTYLTGSMISIPANSLKVGSRYHLVFNVSKTAAGTATPVIYVRFGTNGSTADTARLTHTFNAGTAAADIGTFELWVNFRAVGASGVMQGVAQCNHRLSTTGLQNMPGTTILVTSAAFDTTVANSKIGVSVNGGASAAWTVQLVQAELQNLQ